MPPRHGKSELCSRRFPAYCFGVNPDLKIIACSYSADLASDMNTDCQKVMDNPDYAEVFPVTSLSTKNVVSSTLPKRNSSRFDIVNHKGYYVSAGVGGAITGKGADCFPSGTLIYTNKGNIDIKELYMRPFDYKVLSLNHAKNRLEYREIQAVRSSKAVGLHRITTTGGRVVESTSDHRFYAGGEYRKASSLSPGQSLVCVVQDDQNKASRRLSKVGEAKLQRPLLQQGVLAETPRSEKQFRMPEVLRIGSKGKQVLLKMHSSSQAGISRHAKDRKPKVDLPRVCEDISTNQRPISQEEDWMRGRILLQSELCERSTQQENEWGGQLKLERRNRAILAPFQNNNSSKSQGKGRSKMRCLWNQGSVGLSSHRREYSQQRPYKPSDTVQKRSYYLAQKFGESVSLVEEIRRREGVEVYDIQVAGNHNFFANEILVHNCAIIDDPIKNSEEAESSVYREKVWKWYGSTLYTRLEEGGRVLLVMTRWHEDDLAGRLLKQMREDPKADQWEVVNLPAIKEGPPDQNDPRKEGEALWPGKYDIDQLHKIFSTIGTRYATSLYQQRPSPLEGSIIKREWFEFYQKGSVNIRAVDFYIDSSYTDKTTNDPTAILAYYSDGRKIFLIHCVAKHMEFPELIKFLPEYLEANGYSARSRVYIEPKASGKSIAQEIKDKTTINIIEDNTKKDNSKLTCVFAASPTMEAGRVLLPMGESWTEEFLLECAQFPNGTHDDRVDCLTGAIRRAFNVQSLTMSGMSR